ncbi:hypothetical protein [Candidatus Oleimmundimicrobium sp.]|uniref:hypothetical protein n=1 Tax=Candidatus Oleimmundimicrobium sp. TaxID=3060597 RepID=UPI002725B8A0|nr:hypothetical protein [Candidatus Oleimmundimicrobium sp.]MDO8886806.1 hypothetical protein [Candidatus Oleimmundimicrobium sp.]
MTIKDLIKFNAKKYGEEASLMSVDFSLTSIYDQWFRAYISPPGGAWQELFIEHNNKTHKFYIGKEVKRVDLILQKSSMHRVLFFIGEAKDDYKKILSNRDKIKKCMLDISKFIIDVEIEGKKPFRNGKFKPIFVFIAGLDAKSFGKFAGRVLSKENELIKETINDLEPSDSNRLVIISYIDETKTKFILNFSNKFDSNLKAYFESIFLNFHKT